MPCDVITCGLQSLPVVMISACSPCDTTSTTKFPAASLLMIVPNLLIIPMKQAITADSTVTWGAISVCNIKARWSVWQHLNTANIGMLNRCVLICVSGNCMARLIIGKSQEITAVSISTRTQCTSAFAHSLAGIFNVIKPLRFRPSMNGLWLVFTIMMGHQKS